MRVSRGNAGVASAMEGAEEAAGGTGRWSGGADEDAGGFEDAQGLGWELWPAGLWPVANDIRCLQQQTAITSEGRAFKDHCELVHTHNVQRQKRSV